MSLPVVRRSLQSNVAVPLLALIPVWAMADSLLRGAGLGVAVVAVWLVLRVVDRLLRTRTTDAIRLCVGAVVAGASVALLGLVSAAFVPDVFMAVRSQLPLVSASSLLASGALALQDVTTGERDLRVDLVHAGAIAVALVAIGVVREGLALGVELARHPAGALLLVGLALAAARHWRSCDRTTGPAS